MNKRPRYYQAIVSVGGDITSVFRTDSRECRNREAETCLLNMIRTEVLKHIGAPASVEFTVRDVQPSDWD